MTLPGHLSRQDRARRGITLFVIALLHVAALYGLAKALAPDATGYVEQNFVSAINVFELDPPPPPETAEPEPDSGAEGNPGEEAVPRPVTAQPAPIVLQPPEPAPRASSTGTENRSGARDFGDGTGAAGEGLGTGSGAGGSGQGGYVPPTKPVKIAGDINSAGDYPTPPGGREIRRGRSVTILMTVTPSGRATNCRIVSPSPDPEADRITCRLAVERFRFEPARNAEGEAVTGSYGWRQRWF